MAVTIDGTNGITNVNGSATTPAETGTDTDTGIYYGTNTVSLATNGTQRFTIDSSGNVGIGVTPSAWDTGNSVKALQITSALSLWNYSTNNIYLSQNIYWNGTNRIYTATGTSVSEYSQQNGVFLWHGAGSGTAGNTVSLTERMRIDSSGNVQVGTSSQLYSSKLTVEAGTANATTYTTVATKGGSSMAHQQQSTTGVSTSLVTILTPGTGPYAAFCVVFGSDGTNRFIDLVLFSVGTGTINVISSLSAAGSPAARTYAQNSSSLQLSMGSGTYTVQVTTIGMGS